MNNENNNISDWLKYGISIPGLIPGLIKEGEFLNVQEEALKWPNRIQAPDLIDLDMIITGNCVKIGVPAIEAFWVEVYEVKGDFIVGRIVNNLVYSEKHGFKAMDVIAFLKANVLSITD